MKLLIVTQAVDRDDPVLGFFHQWLAEFATRFSQIHVVCLFEGSHALPENVVVHSLGKERGAASRTHYVFRFLRLAYTLRHEYDAVFIHMNPEYVAVAGDFWHFAKKPIGLWYNHEVGSIWLRLAQPFVKHLFHTSPFAYPARYSNARLMPAGIDTSLFAAGSGVRSADTIYFQGRIAPAKRVHVLLEALRTLRRTRSATVTLVGPEDAAYGAQLRADFADLIEEGAVTFLGARKNNETPRLYGAHAVSVNLTADGNFDKTVLESLSCETPVIVSSRAFAGIVDEAWTVPPGDAEALARALLRLLALPEAARHALGKKGREMVAARHSLTSLADTLAESYGPEAH